MSQEHICQTQWNCRNMLCSVVCNCNYSICCFIDIHVDTTKHGMLLTITLRWIYWQNYVITHEFAKFTNSNLAFVASEEAHRFSEFCDSRSGSDRWTTSRNSIQTRTIELSSYMCWYSKLPQIVVITQDTQTHRGGTCTHSSTNNLCTSPSPSSSFKKLNFTKLSATTSVSKGWVLEMRHEDRGQSLHHVTSISVSQTLLRQVVLPKLQYLERMGEWTHQLCSSGRILV